jgi:hypothetical protein
MWREKQPLNVVWQQRVRTMAESTLSNPEGGGRLETEPQETDTQDTGGVTEENTGEIEHQKSQDVVDTMRREESVQQGRE